MSILLQDLRYALRGLLRQKGFAVVTVLTLALGIGANAAIFSLLNPLIFRPLPVPDADRLCRVFSGRKGGNNYGRMSYPNYAELRTNPQAFEAIAASSWPVPFSMRAGAGQHSSQTEVVWGACDDAAIVL
jgi:putative ABC transport system permease protein